MIVNEIVVSRPAGVPTVAFTASFTLKLSGPNARDTFVTVNWKPSVTGEGLRKVAEIFWGRGGGGGPENTPRRTCARTAAITTIATTDPTATRRSDRLLWDGSCCDVDPACDMHPANAELKKSVCSGCSR